MFPCYSILYFSQKTAARNEIALSYHRVRGLYFLVVVRSYLLSLSLYLFLFH